MLRRPVVLLVVALVAGSALAACGGDDDDGESDAARLRGTEWVLDQEASRLAVVVSAAAVTARFSADTVSGNAGCNSYTAAYEVDGDELTVSDQIATTRRQCANAVMTVETAYLARLPEVVSYAVEGRVLTLRTDDDDRRLVYRAVRADEALAGAWTVVNYFRPGAVVSVITGTEITAEFDAGGVSGNAGCNQYTGPHETDGSEITIGPLATTLRACADPAIDQQETEFLAALELARSFRLDSGNLTLLRADGGIAVTLAPT